VLDKLKATGMFQQVRTLQFTAACVILSGARTAIGTFGGSLAGVPPITLGATAARAALERAGVEGGQIGHVAYGHVINTEPRDMYLSRVAAMEAGIPDTTPAMNVNRLCGSGAQAIVSADAVARWAMRSSHLPAGPRA
jgi:acetyl-CoA acetyltransferase